MKKEKNPRMSEETPAPDNENEVETDTPDPAAPGREDLVDEDAAQADAPADAPLDPEDALKAEVAALNDKLLRAMAETENVRKRAEVARRDAYGRARADFAREILSVADNMERALGSIDEDQRKQSEVVENLYVGVDMTWRELMGAFDRAGIKLIEANGKLFNPALHEAMFEVPNPDVAEGTVVQVIRNGYTLGDFLIRPAQVGVARGGAKADPTAPSAAPEGTPGAGAYDADGDGGRDKDKGATLDENL